MPNYKNLSLLDEVEEVENTPKHKKVEDYLREVDYSNLSSYVPSKFALEFVNFIKMVNDGLGEENKTPVLHYKLLDLICDKNKDRVLNMVFRGAAKTTLIEYLFLYLGTFGGRFPGFKQIELAFYITDSIDNGVVNMKRNLEFRWQNSEFLQQMIPKTILTENRWEFINIQGKRVIIKGYGIATGVRGTKEQAKRPKLVIIDDIFTDAVARSAVSLENIEDTLNSAIEYAIHPQENKIIWNGTPFDASDPLYKAAESGAWSVNVHPVCEQFPCEFEDFRGAWEDRFTYEFIKSAYNRAVKQGRVHAFNKELMLRINSEEERLIKDEDIRWFKREPLLRTLQNYNVYITTDFAVTTNSTSDYSFISVWAYGNKRDLFWIDGICKKQTIDKTIEDLFMLASKYNPISVGLEVSGQQQGFVNIIQKEMVSKNIYFSLAKEIGSTTKVGIRPTNKNTKHGRFMNVVPWFKQGKIYFPMEKKESFEMIEMMDELKLAGIDDLKSRHDDGLDTISMLSQMTLYAPSIVTSPLENVGNVYNLSQPIEDTNYIGNYIV